MPRIRTRLLAPLAVTVLLTLTAASCDDEPTGVTVGAAAVGTVEEIVEAPASVTARAAATVTAPADGTLAELRVDDGDRVRRGDVVAVVDSPATQQRLRDAERALDAAEVPAPAGGGTAGVAAARHRTDARAQAAFDAARDAAAEVTDPALRTALLAQVDAAVEQYAAATEAAAAAVRGVQRGVTGLQQAVGALGSAQRVQAEQAYRLADAAVDALTLRAPVSGTVQLGGTAAGGGAPSLTDLLSSSGASGAAAAGAAAAGAPAAPAATLPGADTAVPRGAAVTAGTPVLTIVDTGALGLSAEVDETDVLLVRPGVTATAELDAAAGAGYPARVRAVDQLPTTSARGGVSYRVRLTLGAGRYTDGRGAAPAPRPGMSAVVRLTVRRAAGAVTVPASAVVSADGRDTVWAVRGGRATRVPVAVGVQGEDVVQVRSGLAAGERVVVAGADRVRAGQELR